jgi:hypothetical protein
MNADESCGASVAGSRGLPAATASRLTGAVSRDVSRAGKGFSPAAGLKMSPMRAASEVMS